MVSGERSAVRGKRLAAVILFLGIGAAQPANAQFEAGIPVGTKAPAVAINDLKGRPLDLGTVLGTKPVLIEFWATWCTSCQAMMPRLAAMRAEFGDAVEFIGINVTISETREGVAAYVREHAPPFRTLYDEAGDGARAYEPPATSFIVIVDAAGTVVYTGSGGNQNLEPALRRVTGR
jgi:thiol-disulfide isomerase/thioredoxin